MSKPKNQKIIIKIGKIKLSIRKTYNWDDIPNKIFFFLGDKKHYVTRFFSQKSRNAYNLEHYKYSREDIFNLIETSKSYPKNILTPEQTIEKILNERLSVARIGDGEETRYMLKEGNKFPLLKNKLLEICREGSTSNCLVCLNNLNYDNPERPDFYRKAFAYYYSKKINSNDIECFNIQSRNINIT